MLVKSLQSKVFERVVRGKNGRLARVRFEVAEIEGKIYGRVLSAEPVYEVGSYKLKVASCKPRQFPTLKKESSSILPQVVRTATRSPYFSCLDFFISQMIRAPAHAERARKQCRTNAEIFRIVPRLFRI